MPQTKKKYIAIIFGSRQEAFFCQDSVVTAANSTVTC